MRSISVLLALLCSTAGWASALDVAAKTLEAHVVHPGLTTTERIGRIVHAGTDTVLVLEARPARLLRVIFDGPTEVVVENGPAPWQMDENLTALSRPEPRSRRKGPGRLVMHRMRQPTSVSIEPDGSIAEVRAPRIVTAVVDRPNGALATLFTSTDAALARMLGGADQVAWFEVAGFGATVEWKLVSSALPFEFGDDPAINLARSTFTRLLPRDEKTTYWVQCVGDGRVRFLADEGTVVGGFDVPRGDVATALGPEAAPVQRDSVVRDVVVDRAGRLHVLRGIYVNEDGEADQGREILVFDRDGAVVDRYAVERRLTCFDLALDESFYVGVETETLDIVRLDRMAAGR